MNSTRCFFLLLPLAGGTQWGDKQISSYVINRKKVHSSGLLNAGVNATSTNGAGVKRDGESDLPFASFRSCIVTP